MGIPFTFIFCCPAMCFCKFVLLFFYLVKYNQSSALFWLLQKRFLDMMYWYRPAFCKFTILKHFTFLSLFYRNLIVVELWLHVAAQRLAFWRLWEGVSLCVCVKLLCDESLGFSAKGQVEPLGTALLCMCLSVCVCMLVCVWERKWGREHKKHFKYFHSKLHELFAFCNRKYSTLAQSTKCEDRHRELPPFITGSLANCKDYCSLC